MKILVVCQYFAPEPFRVSTLCESMQALGHEVRVLTGMPNYPEGRLYPGYGLTGPWHETNQSGTEIFRVPLVPRGNGGKVSLALNYATFAFNASVRSLFFLHQPFDLVFVYQLSPITMAVPAILIAKLKRIPLVLYSLDLWPDSVSATGVRLPSFLQRCLTIFSRFIYRQPSRLLVSSRGFMTRMAELGVANEKLQYWPQAAEGYAAEQDESRLQAIRDQMPFGFVVMFAGNIGVAQGFPTLLAAAEMLRDVQKLHWVILGDGRMRQWVENEVRARELAHCVHLLGRHPGVEMPFWYSLADSMLVSLKKDPVFAATLPAKVQSYMACGRPILAAMDGEGANVVREADAGFSCASDDPAGLAGIVRQMMALPKPEREQLGKNGAIYAAKQFNQDKLRRELDMVLSGLVQKENSK